jgi:hypothetical protein
MQRSVNKARIGDITALTSQHCSASARKFIGQWSEIACDDRRVRFVQGIDERMSHLATSTSDQNVGISHRMHVLDDAQK